MKVTETKPLSVFNKNQLSNVKTNFAVLRLAEKKLHSNQN